MLPIHQGQGMISHLQWTKMVRLWRDMSFFENMSHKKLLTPLPMTMIVGIDAVSFWEFYFSLHHFRRKNIPINVLSPFLGCGVLLFSLFSFCGPGFYPCPPHPPPLFTHRRTGMGYNATATRFVRKNFVDQAGGNPSLQSIDLDQKLQEICVFF